MKPNRKADKDRRAAIREKRRRERKKRAKKAPILARCSHGKGYGGYCTRCQRLRREGLGYLPQPFGQFGQS